MKLLLDIGNTRVKWAVLEQGELRATGSAPHRGRKLEAMATEYWSGLPAPTRVVAVNVAGTDIERELRTWCETQWKLTPRFVTATAQAAGISNAYAEPGRLGADRWAAIIGAYHAYGAPACVIDCGTAITIDAVDVDGRHRGGLILPGVQLMRQSLYRETRGIPDEGGGAAVLLGRDTRAAVTGGTLYAAAACIDRVAADLTTQLGGPMRLLLTGGDTELLRPLLRGRYEFDPHLVLRGLAVVAEEKA